MALTKIVNGVEYKISPSEEKRIKAEWDSNKKKKEKRLAETGYIHKRAKEYPPVGDQLDAILKHLNYMQMDGQSDLVKDLDKIVGEWLAVKAKYPKPDK